MPKKYLVEWAINIDEEDGGVDPRSAAEAALRIQRDPESIATVFVVTDEQAGERTMVDLMDDVLEPFNVGPA